MTTEFDDIIMRGSQQRDYGTLVGNCQIYLDRFAIVLGSETESPSTASSIVVGSDLSFYQCGFEHSGNFSLLYFLTLTALLPAAAFEVRICKNDNKRIVIETYGDVAATQAMSLWFNTAKSAHKESSVPTWVKLNGVASGSTMTYATTSYVFKEDVSESRGSVVIDCCKKCPTCQCLNCYICDRLYLKAVGSETKIYGTSIKHGYGKNLGNSACVFKKSGTIPVTSFCPFSMTLDMSNYKFNLYFLDDDGTTEHLIETYEWFQSTADYDLIVEYKIECDTVAIWSYLDDEVVSIDSNIAGKTVTTHGYPFEIESFDSVTNKLTVNRNTIPFRSISSENTNAFRYGGPLKLSTSITLGKICLTQQRILGNVDISCPLWLPTGNTRVKMKFTLTHDAPTINSYGTNGGMYYVRCECTGGTGYSVFIYEYFGEDTKSISLDVDFSELDYEYYTYDTGYIFYFGIIIEYENCDGAILNKTLSASIEILDVYDGCTGESLLSSLPQFNTIALQYPNRDGISFTATFSSLGATTNPVTTSTFDFDYLNNCVGTRSVKVCKNYIHTISPALTVKSSNCQIGKTIKLYIDVRSAYGMTLYIYKGTYIADVESVDQVNNLITVTNIIHIGDSSEGLSDRSAHVTDSFTSSGWSSWWGWMSGQSHSPDPVNIGYIGPIAGRDAIVTGTIVATITTTAGFFNNGLECSFDCGNGLLASRTLSYPLTNGLLQQVVTLTLLSTPVTNIPYIYAPKTTVYFKYYVSDETPRGSVYNISIEASNMKIVDCKGNSYNENDILPGSILDSGTTLSSILMTTYL
ncbi:MAG: hypothetical protein M0R80_10015 [Proteobacteria bacterium]|jgi:hypothetical protein|nr:hypothetical protein [Pseudomonadota bacterium]